MSDKIPTIAFRPSREQYDKLLKLRKDDQTMTDVIRVIIDKGLKPQPNTRPELKTETPVTIIKTDLPERKRFNKKPVIIAGVIAGVLYLIYYISQLQLCYWTSG